MLSLIYALLQILYQRKGHFIINIIVADLRSRLQPTAHKSCRLFATLSEILPIISISVLRSSTEYFI